jgi:hypothetical protein
MGRYATMWLDALRRSSPETYRSLEREGSLQRLAITAEQSALAAGESLFGAMLKSDPLPDGPPMARVEHAARLQRRAEEIAQAHLLEPFAAIDAREFSEEETTG